MLWQAEWKESTKGQLGCFGPYDLLFMEVWCESKGSLGQSFFQCILDDNACQVRCDWVSVRHVELGQKDELSNEKM